MNKIYSLLGIGLLSAATLSSCKEDVFIEGGDELQRGESQTYVAVASIRGYENTDKESSTRANVQDDGSSFMWNADDKVTLWNGTNGYDFTTINYDESEPSGNVEFAGNGNFEEGATLGNLSEKRCSDFRECFHFYVGRCYAKCPKSRAAEYDAHAC